MEVTTTIEIILKTRELAEAVKSYYADKAGRSVKGLLFITSSLHLDDSVRFVFKQNEEVK